jgi:hypothetical protein
MSTFGEVIAFKEGCAVYRCSNGLQVKVPWEKMFLGGPEDIVLVM